MVIGIKPIDRLLPRACVMLIHPLPSGKLASNNISRCFTLHRSQRFCAGLKENIELVVVQANGCNQDA
eukprot:1117235-Amphidinium_carterae.2